MSKKKPSVTKQLNLLEHRLALLRKILEADFLYVSILPSPSPITLDRESIYKSSKEMFMANFPIYGIGCRINMHTHAITFHKPVEDCGIGPEEVEAKYYKEVGLALPIEDKIFLDSKYILIKETYEDYSKIGKQKVTMFRFGINRKAVSETIKDLQAERDIIESSVGKKVL